MKYASRIAVVGLILFVAAGACQAVASDDAKELLANAPPSSDYPNSGFVNLIDEARTTINSDGSWETTTRVAAKIFNERGRRIANVHLGYNSAFEEIEIIRARTIKKDGTIIEVKPEDVVEVSPYSSYAMYSSVKAKVVVLPGIEDDCIIDYEWSVTGKHSIMPKEFWSSWFYQSQEPTMLSRYSLRVSSAREFKYASYNTKTTPEVTTSTDGKTKTYVWEGQALSEIDPEPYMPSLSEICPWFELSSVKSWDDVAAWYWKLVEPQMKPTPEIKAEVEKLIKGKDTDIEKAKTLFYWVSDKIRYVGLEFGAGAYEPHSAKDVFENLYGDCKDQATLLVTMLRVAGLKAYPVLVPTGFRGATSKRLASPGIFDHAITVAEIEGKYVWMDTTVEVCPFGELPEGDRGREVMIVRETGGEFVKTPEFEAGGNESRQTVAIDLREDGSISARVAWASTGSADLAARATYKYARPSKIKEGFEATVTSITPSAKLNDFSVSDPLARDEPLRIKYDFEAAGWANRTVKFLIFRPSLYQSVLSGTPFSKPERTYDIVFSGSSSNVAETEIRLPEGFAVEEIPQNTSLKADFAAYEAAYELNGQTLKVTEKLVRNHARIPASRYQEVREFYEDAIQTQKQQVVLRATLNGS